MKNKNQKPNSYSKRLQRRVSAGKVYYSLPVNAKGDPILNPRDFIHEKNKKSGKMEVRTRQFTRTARADEVESIREASK